MTLKSGRLAVVTAASVLFGIICLMISGCSNTDERLVGTWQDQKNPGMSLRFTREGEVAALLTKRRVPPIPYAVKGRYLLMGEGAAQSKVVYNIEGDILTLEYDQSKRTYKRIK